MIRRALAIAAALLCSGTLVVPALAGSSEPPTELLGNGPTPIPLKNQAMISKSEWGLRYRAGQQDSRLVITVDRENNRVTYRDRGTRAWRKNGKAMPRWCDRQNVRRGISATCRIPAEWRNGETMFLEIWPRLGDDYIDGRTLPSSVRLWALGDRGHDTVWGGAGDDFVNGAQDNDEAHGGGGNDWLRTGIGNDKVWGDDGDDLLRTVDGSDEIHGGAGVDEIGCGPGQDTAYSDGVDAYVRDCETTKPE